MKKIDLELDYIIVGGGVSGCVLANRLSENPELQVCLIEAGGENDNLLVNLPGALIVAIEKDELNWKYDSEPEPELNNHVVYTPRGKGLGGSSCINAQVYIRGSRHDYDGWAAQGNDGWSYEELLPLFKKSERFYAGENEFHGGKGEMPISQHTGIYSLCEKFLKAGQEAGYSLNSDFNGASQDGLGTFDVFQEKGMRVSAAKAFIKNVKERVNLHILTNTQIDKVIFEGKRAVGVEYTNQQGAHKLYAKREIVLSAGVYNSPQLLLLSGVGPKAELEQQGVELVHDLKGVGENLQNHVDVFISRQINNTESWATTPLALMRNFSELAKLMFKKKGLFTSNFSEVGGFIRSDEALSEPDVQVHFIPMLLDDHGRDQSPSKQYGYTLHACILDPESSGKVSLKGTDPKLSPKIEFKFFSEKSDLDRMIKAVKKIQAITQQTALKTLDKRSVFPDFEMTTDAEIETFVRDRAQHLYHGVGTCKMGNDEMSVVDSQLKVHGIDGLRVVDASIMPKIIHGNTQATSMLIAEKAAELILSKL